METRRITKHEIAGVKETVIVEAVGERDNGGANTRYDFKLVIAPNAIMEALTLQFQDGILEDGVNGVTMESVIGVLIDRLDGYQSGPLECRENQDARWHLNRALSYLKLRTESRMRRGCEGTELP